MPEDCCVGIHIIPPRRIKTYPAHVSCSSAGYVDVWCLVVGLKLSIMIIMHQRYVMSMQ